MGKWKAVAIISVIIMIIAAAVIWFVFNKADKTLNKAKSTAEATDRIISGGNEIISNGKRIWELFSGQEKNDVNAE